MCITFTKIAAILSQSVELLIRIMTSDSDILGQVLYQDQNVVELIGDVIYPNKKCGVEKSVYITSFEDINYITQECKQCKTCTLVLDFPFSYQKPCVTLFGWTYCLRKKDKVGLPKKRKSRL